MKDFQLSFASILKYISIVLIVCGVIGFFVALFFRSGTLFRNCFADIACGVLFYALSIVVHAAAIYIKKNTPDPKE